MFKTDCMVHRAISPQLSLLQHWILSNDPPNHQTWNPLYLVRKPNVWTPCMWNPTKNTTWCISITSGRMKLILCSFVVLVSTSKPQNMSSKVHLVFEIAHDNHKLLEFRWRVHQPYILIFLILRARGTWNQIHIEVCKYVIHFKISLD